MAKLEVNIVGRPSKVALGRRYRDPISGFEGTATGRFEYLHGCVRWQLSGQIKGEPKDFVFDEPQLEVIETPNPLTPTRETGGPKDTPPRAGL